MPDRFKKLNSIQSFQLFCLESYRNTKGISAIKALHDFKTYNVFSFLEEAYQVLHTQSQHYILSEINRYIQQHDNTVPR
ncbi:MAG: DUF3791 domain-containing protein [Prolixibacteraceae bacterium]|nr:DUF3791 domain-containing protein [Prolixibacteraceae bacterium]